MVGNKRAAFLCLIKRVFNEIDTLGGVFISLF